MDQPALLVLVRHGQSLLNELRPGVHFKEKSEVEQIGDLPDHKMPLTELGWQQARATGLYLRKQFGEFDVAFHSNYTRTEQTLEGLLQAYTPEERDRLLVRHSHLIRERERGYTFAMFEDEINQTFPWLEEHYNRAGYFYFRHPGGQSHADVCDQAFMFLNFEVPKYSGKKMLLVEHGGTIRAQRFVLEDWTPDQLVEDAERGASANCGVTVYRYSEIEQGLKLESYNTVCW